MAVFRCCWIMIILAMLSSCISYYHENDSLGGIPIGGYSDKRINANTVIVKYTVTDFTPNHQTHTYLLYRCAEVTLHNGYDYFIITSENASRSYSRNAVAVIKMFSGKMSANLPRGYYATDIIAQLGPEIHH